MEEKMIFELIKETPLTLIALMLFAIWSYIRNTNKLLFEIKSNMVSKSEFDVLDKDVKEQKEKKVWLDLFLEFRKNIDNRIERIENIINNKSKSQRSVN